MTFDNTRAIVFAYDKTGFMTHATFCDERDDLSEFLRLKKAIKIRAKELSI